MTGFDDHKEVKEMIFEKKTLLLRNGKECILRPTAPEDSEEMIRYMKETAAESPFLLRYPDEVQYTIEDEQRILMQLMNDPHTVMMVAEVDGKIAGNCSVSGIGSKRKVRHRCSYAIALYDRFRGMGVGSAMTGYALELARSIGYEQIELEVAEENDNGRNLYKKFGFVETGKIPDAMRYEDGSYTDLVLMSRKL